MTQTTTPPRRRTALGRFLKDDRGNVSIEMVIWMPLVLFVLAATFTLFDAYRQKSLNIKAAYTISDAISRETDPIDDSYLDGMMSILRYLTEAPSADGHAMRVTMVRYDGAADRYDVRWSQTRGAAEAMTTDLLAEMRDRLPTLLHNETVIVVETVSRFEPVFDIPQLTTESFYNFVFTRPRFAPQVIWQGA